MRRQDPPLFRQSPIVIICGRRFTLAIMWGWVAGLVGVVVVVFASLTLGSIALVPLVAIAAAVGTLALKPRTATLLLFTIALVASVAVPFTRLSVDMDALKIAIPGVILACAVLVMARSGAQASSLIIGVAYFLFYGVATAITPDRSEWAIYATTVSVGVSGIILGGQIRRHDAWPQARAAIIAVATVAAAYSVVEAIFALTPIWQGAKRFADGTSMAQRSELITGMFRAQVTFGHPLILTFLLLVALTLVLRDLRSNRARVWLSVILLAGIIASGSRGGLIIAAILIVFQAGRATWAGRTPIALTVAGVAVAATVPLWSPAVDAFLNTGSFTHRFGAFEAGMRLLAERVPLNVWFGDGAAATPRLYAAGILSNDGLAAIDNQLVLSLAEVGIIGVVLLAAIIGTALERAEPGLRVALIVVLIEFGSFDVLAWPLSAFILWTFVGVAITRRAPARAVDNSAQPAAALTA